MNKSGLMNDCHSQDNILNNSLDFHIPLVEAFSRPVFALHFFFYHDILPTVLIQVLHSIHTFFVWTYPLWYLGFWCRLFFIVSLYDRWHAWKVYLLKRLVETLLWGCRWAQRVMDGWCIDFMMSGGRGLDWLALLQVELVVVVLVVLVGLTNLFLIFLPRLAFAPVAPFSKWEIQIVAFYADPVTLSAFSMLFMSIVRIFPWRLNIMIHMIFFVEWVL